MCCQTDCGRRRKALPPIAGKSGVVPESVALIALQQAALHTVSEHGIHKLVLLILARVAFMSAGKAHDDGNFLAVDSALLSSRLNATKPRLAPRRRKWSRARGRHVCKTALHKLANLIGSDGTYDNQNHAFRVVPFAVKGPQTLGGCPSDAILRADGLVHKGCAFIEQGRALALACHGFAVAHIFFCQDNAQFLGDFFGGKLDAIRKVAQDFHPHGKSACVTGC